MIIKECMTKDRLTLRNQVRNRTPETYVLKYITEIIIKERRKITPERYTNIYMTGYIVKKCEKISNKEVERFILMKNLRG